MNRQDKKIYLQGQLDLLDHIRDNMYGQVICGSLKAVFTEIQLDKLRNDIKDKIKEIEDDCE